MIEGIPLRIAVNALTHIVNNKHHKIRAVSIVSLGVSPQFHFGLCKAMEILCDIDTFSSQGMIFAFDMMQKSESFFFEIKTNTLSFGLTSYDVNGNVIIRNNEVWNNHECALCLEIINALDVEDYAKIKVILEDENEIIVDLYDGNWRDISSKVCEKCC